MQVETKHSLFAVLQRGNSRCHRGHRRWPWDWRLPAQVNDMGGFLL